MRPVSLGFVKSKDGYFYRSDMAFSEFKDAFGSPALAAVPSGPPTEWLRSTTIEGNPTLLRQILTDLPESFPYEPAADAHISVSVNVEYTRIPSAPSVTNRRVDGAT